MKKSLIFITALLLVTVPCVVFGAQLGEVARSLTVGGDILKKLLWAACIVVGILLIAAAFTQFQIHRRNPKLVPLTTPVMYVILGIAIIAIPFIDTLSGFSESKVAPVSSSPESNTQPPSGQQQYYDPNDIDAPIY